MSINEINIKIETLKEWEAIAAEASAMVESIKDEIKRHMDAQGLEELEAGTHIMGKIIACILIAVLAYACPLLALLLLLVFGLFSL